jgi:prepilin-type N-terminal cleavage/methylation domain-containing protein
MRALRDERGFTLVEMLVASFVGVIILFAAFSLIDAASSSQRKTDARIEAVQRGRTAMEVITRQLRSQICLGQGKPSLLAGESDRVVFYASLDKAPTRSGILQIDERTLRFESTGGNRGRIIEEVRRGTGTPPNVTFPSSPSTSRVVVADIERAGSGAPIFRYFKYDAPNSPNMVELSRPVASSQRDLTVRVDVAFDSYPKGGEGNARVVYADQAFIRTADPTDPEHSPKCI